MGALLRVEFHCHTVFSGDSMTSLEDLLAACRRRDIDRIVITDHNTIAGAQRAQQFDPQRVIVGEEIMTQAGELLAAFVKEEVPAGLKPMEAIRHLRQQDAFISVSHPFDRLRGGHWALSDLLTIASHVDAIETFNARCMWWPPFNWQAQAFARQHNLPGTAGSDAHIVYEIGKATLLLPAFEDANSLKTALALARPRLSLSPGWVYLGSRLAKIRKQLGA